MLESIPQGTMQQIARAVRAGNLDQAAMLAARAITEFPHDSVLAAFAGVIEFQRGQFSRAIPLLQFALSKHPQDTVVRGNLAESHFKSGNMAAAQALCDDRSAQADKSLRIASLGAFLAQESGDFDKAIRLYSLILEQRPDDWSSLNNMGNALSALGRHEEAISALQKAVALAGPSQPIKINLGNALIQVGRIDEAEELLRAAAEAAPEDPEPLLSLFAMFRDLGREDESYDAIASAAERAPGRAEIRSDYGQEASKRNEYSVAEVQFEAALSLDPQLGPAYVGMGSLYERTNREQELDPLIERARANKVDAATISYLEALILRRAGDIANAYEALEAAGDVILEGRRFHLRGTMLDRLERYDEAFESFIAMNNYWLESPTQPKARAALHRQHTLADMDKLSTAWLQSWTPPPPQDDWPTPVFLVGFPRSGTTLLDTMLMREPRALVLEEEPILADLESRSGGMEAFPGLNPAALREGRQFYFEQVAKFGEVNRNTFVVDKHPLHLNKVAVIQRFFPEARYILALRHPCDVLLSCFLTNFRINNAMSNFLDLEDSASMYDITFLHWEKARHVFNLPVSTVVYERLVEDPSRELRPLFDWLGLDWPGNDFDHREAARARGVVSTASYAQVTEPIYTRARGRWRNYEQYLTPIFDRLRPWVEKYGYSLNDGRIPAWPDSGQSEA